MLERVWERARAATLVTETVIATDSPEIFDVAQAFGAQVLMTSASHSSGTDRVAEAAELFAASLVVNVQGDEPFIEPSAIDQAITPLLSRGDAVMSTLMTRFRDPGGAAEPSAVKVVADLSGHALYFSRLPIPFRRDIGDTTPTVWYKHLGLYVYDRDFLQKFPHLPRGPLEAAEKLEQLRVLENGYKIRVVETEHDSIGVDTDEDLARAREIALRLEEKTQEHANV